MVTNISHSAVETQALGELWASEARTGWVIGLTGELGAGKTQLVKGLARGLGITALVHSPTFNLVNVYPGGRLTLHHIDLYRLASRDEVFAAGLEEYLAPSGVTVVEWAEKIYDLELTIRNLRKVRIEIVNEFSRKIFYEDSGA